MSEILIFAGTTEGRRLSECLSASEIAHTVCVATEYGETVLDENPFLHVRCGRMDREAIKAFLKDGDFAAVVDATHPYAREVTENIRAAVRELDGQGMQIPYFRLQREFDAAAEGVHYFTTNEECMDALAKTEGNILLTTGSKELPVYCAVAEVKDRLFARVLPGIESLTACMEQGLKGKQIIAMQGPFSAELNEALIRQYKIACLVTKESGRSGGYREKLEAAKNAGIPVYVIGCPKEEQGDSFGQVCAELEKRTGQKIRRNGKLLVTLAGAGMGQKNNLTAEVQDAVERADILLGAQRLIVPYRPGIEKKPYYLAKQIIPYLKEIQEKNMFAGDIRTVILFSGDSGFYSGCQALYAALTREIEQGVLRASVRILPGISSVSYLAACIGESYEDAAVYSMHGKELYNLARRIEAEPKTYLLTSGAGDVRRLGSCLCKAGMTDCEVTVGCRLSYPDETIRRLTPQECCELEEEGLYTCFVRNPRALPKRLTHGMPDTAFLREKIPMTKEEVREVGICRLRLHRGAVVYDIGSGTGSVAVELAALSDDIQVYAVEQKKEAVSLIGRNRDRFLLENLTVIEAKAPEGLTELPPATHAFIGGSGGNLKEILETLYRKNPKMRVVITAVSLETICEIREILTLYPTEHYEIVQLQASRAKQAGRYHLMQAENPVWICAFEFDGRGL